MDRNLDNWVSDQLYALLGEHLGCGCWRCTPISKASTIHGLLTLCARASCVLQALQKAPWSATSSPWAARPAAAPCLRGSWRARSAAAPARSPPQHAASVLTTLVHACMIPSELAAQLGTGYSLLGLHEEVTKRFVVAGPAGGPRDAALCRGAAGEDPHLQRHLSRRADRVPAARARGGGAGARERVLRAAERG